jgi:hypothetical protein
MMVVELFSHRPVAMHYDEIIDMGQYRSNPCRHPVRMVSVLWGTTWYRYSRARLHDDTTELIPFYQQHHTLLGLVKATRQRQRQQDQQWAELWGNVPGCCPAVPP